MVAVSGLPVTVVGDDERDAAVATLVAAFGAGAFERRTVWKLGELSAVALWLGPGIAPDGDVIVSVLAETVSPDKHEDMFSVLGQMDRAHPTFPHWYLPWFGVRPELQGGGLGGRLLEHCLRFVDESHLLCVHRDSQPAHDSVLSALGFKAVSVAVAGTCPPVTSMLRRWQPPDRPSRK